MPIRHFDIITTEVVQLVHVNNYHWVYFSSIGCFPGHVNLLNSLPHPSISGEIRELAMNILGPNFKGIVQIPVQQQKNSSDCGVFARAFATCLVYVGNPYNIFFDTPIMRVEVSTEWLSATMPYHLNFLNLIMITCYLEGRPI